MGPPTHDASPLETLTDMLRNNALQLLAEILKTVRMLIYTPNAYSSDEKGKRGGAWGTREEQNSKLAEMLHEKTGIKWISQHCQTIPKS